MPLSLGLFPLRAFPLRNRFITRFPADIQRTYSSNGYKPLRSTLLKEAFLKNNNNEQRSRSNLFNQLNKSSLLTDNNNVSGVIQLKPPNWASIQLAPIQKILWNGKFKTSQQSLDEFRQLHNITFLKGASEKPSNVEINLIQNFQDVEWPAFISDALKNANFKEPTPIQSVAWPILLKGHNLVGISETGSGKTLAFALPALWHIIKQETSLGQGPRVIVIAPVRELASQISEQITKYCNRTNIRVATLIGGPNKNFQINQVNRKPQIIVCTPGRLSDLVNSGVLSLQNVSYVVLDEADRLLDMGFEHSIRAILKQIRPDRQICLFTATWPKEVRGLASEFMGSDFYRLNVGADVSPAKNVSQHIEICDQFEKLDLLIGVLKMKEAENSNLKALIFCNQKITSVGVANHLRNCRFAAECFHGDMEQRQRDQTLQAFRSGRIRCLVASDAAARGLDVPDISLVVNHDFPLDMETYVHRIGRTGRAGAKGESISFVTSENEKMFPAIVQLLKLGNQPIPPEIAQYVERKNNRNNRTR